MTSGRPWPVAGFVTRDGVTHRYEGWVQRAGDSLLFLRPPRGRGIGSLTPVREFALADSEVISLRLTMPNRTRGLLTIGIGAGLVIGIAAWIVVMNPHGARLD